MRQAISTQTVLLSGASGLLGTGLRHGLALSGLSSLQLVRGAVTGKEQIHWNPGGVGAIQDPNLLEGCDAAIHLSGASIAARRWTPQYRRELVESRVGSTASLARTLAELKHPPRTLIVASATGYYGDCGDEMLDETSAQGKGFLAELCGAWEEAARPAGKAGIRVIHARFGVVLANRSGALEKMLPAFRYGFGGRLGSGRQWMSWISLLDAVDALLFLLAREDLSGPVNVTAPNPITNAEFTRKLAKQLHRPALLPVPALALRLAFGDMAGEALLASQRAMPSKLMMAGFHFRHSILGEAMHALLT